MYSYYALRSIGIRMPRSLAMTITSLQILQMIVGLLITLYAHLSIGNNCPNVYSNLTIYGKYFGSLNSLTGPAQLTIDSTDRFPPQASSCTDHTWCSFANIS